jgi:hypothetical protein
MLILPQQIKMKMPYDTSAYALVMKESEWELNDLASLLSQSCTVNGKDSPSKTWLTRLKRDKYLKHLSGRILKPCHTNDFWDKWICYRRASHVSPFQVLATSKVWMTQGISSHTSLMESEDANQTLFNWKMSKESSVAKHPMENQYSNMSADLWKQKVTLLKQSWSQRVKLAHHTKESESSSLVYPTPSTTDSIGGSQMNQTELTSKGFKTVRKGTKTAYGSKLRDAVDKIESWPTPTSAEGTKIGSQANYGQKGLSNHPAIQGEPNRPKGRKDGKKTWATPCARDYKDSPNDKTGLAMTLGKQVNGWQPSQAAQMKNKQSGKSQESLSKEIKEMHDRQKQWKTPTATNMQRTEEGMKKRAEARAKTGRGYNEGCLEEQVINRESWATPSTMEHLPSGVSQSYKESLTGRRKKSSNLRDQVWPTPQVGGQDERADTRIARGRDLNLPAKATLDQPKGYLNPSWVEQLMGLPKGWTQLSSAEAESDNRVPRLKLLGNGVVPQCAAKAFAILFNQIMNGK